MANEIIAIVRSVANNAPPPARCKITKVYENNYVDVQTSLGELKYVETLGTGAKENDNAIILFLDETYNDYVIIAGININEIYSRLDYLQEEIDEIEAGGIDINKYDVDFTYALVTDNNEGRIHIKTRLFKKET